MGKKYDKLNLISPQVGGSAFSVMMVALLVVTLIGQLVLMAFGILEGFVFQSVSATFSAIAMIFVICFAVRVKKLQIAEVTGVVKFNPVYILLALLFCVSMFFGLGFVNNSIAEFLISIGLNGSGINLDLTSGGKLVTFIIVFGALPAFVEEIFFRGLILKSLDKAGTVLSSVFCALCFALYHASFVQLVYQFIYGLGLCFIAKLSKSTVPCIVAHFINNAAVLILQYFGVAINFYNSLILVGGLVGLLAFSIIVFLLIKSDKNDSKDKEWTLFLPAALVGSLVCLVLMISSLFV